VNDAPSVQGDKTVTTRERSPAVSLGLSTPTDVNGDRLSVTVTAAPTGGTVHRADGSAVVAGQALTVTDLPGLTFAAAAGATGNVGVFAYSVDDGHGGVAAQTVSLQVTPMAAVMATFNPLAYLAANPDVAAAFGIDTAAATKHFVDYGAAEGRPTSFDALAYIASYPDLAAAFGTDTDAATRHYIEHGRAEGRAPSFDALAYIASYPDLAVAFGTDAAAGARHYIQNGMAEGRSVTFDPYNYLASYPDLAVAFGTDADAAARHYIQNGMAEGRTPEAFDALRYIASNPDLITAFGPDTQAAEIHYIEHGRAEGRSLTSFDPAAYLASHPEAAAVFGAGAGAVEMAYIQQSQSEAGMPAAVAMAAAGMTGSQAQGLDSGHAQDPNAAWAGMGGLAAADGTAIDGQRRAALPA
jgi:serralysin